MLWVAQPRSINFIKAAVGKNRTILDLRSLPARISSTLEFVYFLQPASKTNHSSSKSLSRSLQILPALGYTYRELIQLHKTPQGCSLCFFFLQTKRPRTHFSIRLSFILLLTNLFSSHGSTVAHNTHGSTRRTLDHFIGNLPPASPNTAQAAWYLPISAAAALHGIYLLQRLLICRESHLWRRLALARLMSVWHICMIEITEWVCGLHRMWAKHRFSVHGRGEEDCRMTLPCYFRDACMQ